VAARPAYNRGMFDAVLRFLADEVNAFMLRRTGDGELVRMVPSRLVSDAGNPVIADGNLAISLFQVEEERALREPLPERVVLQGRELQRPPPLRLNLVVVVAARIAAYDVALARLALAVRCFHAKPIHTPADSPGLPAGLERLTIEMLPLGLEQMNQLWSCIGTRLLPSAVYRVRLLELREDDPLGSGSPILHIETRVEGR